MEKKRQQDPLTVEQQIQNLEHLGLLIEDKEEAEVFLNDVSYFRVIKAYSLGLKPKNGNYHPGVTFSQVISLYKFNAKFRQLLFPMIERVEINLRCRIANYFCVKYGVLGYEDPANFTNPEYHKALLEDIDQEVSRNKKAPFVKNFRENYQDGKLPLYALVELFSFGTLSKFFKNMKNKDKKEIGTLYGVGYTYLESWIESIAYTRNLCAHYGRLYNAKIPKSPRLYQQYSTQGIGNNRIFGVLLCIGHLVPHDEHWAELVDGLDKLIQRYPTVRIETMGFPKNWRVLLSGERVSEETAEKIPAPVG